MLDLEETKNKYIDIFKNAEIEIEFKNDYIYFKKENPIVLLKALGWEDKFEERLESIAKVMTLETLNHIYPTKPNLTFLYPNTLDITFMDVDKLSRWYNKLNNQFNTEMGIIKRNEQEFKSSCPFRPTFMVNAYRTLLKEVTKSFRDDLIILMKPVDKNIRSTIFNYNSKTYEFKYIWHDNFETLKLSINGEYKIEHYINYSDKLSNDQIMDIIKTFVELTINDINGEL